jgi:riboflavin synthase
MFTGLVEALAEVAEVVSQPPGMRIAVQASRIANVAQIGDSIAMNGCCLTVVCVDQEKLEFEAGAETLACTSLGELSAGEYVNLETALRAGDPIGGHYVTGHVDTVGWVDERRDDSDWCTMYFSAPRAQLRQMASKGSVAVDGVSLTIVDVTEKRFSVALIPHTLDVTTLGKRGVGDKVNLETDVLAKYVERQLENSDE